MANLMAMLVQYLSAKLGIVTDQNLPELCRATYPRALTWFLWLQAEAMAMATDVAEFMGAALGLNLLFRVPLLPAGFITGAIAFLILELQRHGLRRFELAITALLGIILAGVRRLGARFMERASATATAYSPARAAASSASLGKPREDRGAFAAPREGHVTTTRVRSLRGQLGAQPRSQPSGRRREHAHLTCAAPYLSSTPPIGEQLRCYRSSVACPPRSGPK